MIFFAGSAFVAAAAIFDNAKKKKKPETKTPKGV